MDEFTEELAELAYQTCKTRSRRGDVSLRELKAQIGSHWITYRNETIARWANQVHDRANLTHLRRLFHKVDRALEARGEYWEHPTLNYTGQWVAWGLAVLRWLNREYAGVALVPRYTDEELEAWRVERRPPEQLKLL